MKCYRMILSFFIVISIQSGYAQESTNNEINLYSEIIVGTLLPVDEIIISNGEIYTIELQSDMSDDELEAFTNSKINKVMYLMEVILEPKRRLLKVFVTDPPNERKKKKKLKKDLPVFDMNNFDYRPVKKEQQAEFFQVEIPFDLKNNRDQVIMFCVFAVLVMLIIPLFWLGYRFYKSRKLLRREKTMKRARADSLLELISTAKERIDFETIHKKRDEIKFLLDYDPSLLSSLLHEIDKIQYKKNWDEVQMELIKDKLKLIRDHGINSGV